MTEPLDVLEAIRLALDEKRSSKNVDYKKEQSKETHNSENVLKTEKKAKSAS